MKPASLTAAPIAALVMALAAASLAALAILSPVAAAEPKVQTMTVGVRHNMEATLYTPDGPGPFSSILLFHTSLGVGQVDREYCARLAREGFICIVPAFLRAHGIRQETKEATFTTEREAIQADFDQIIGELNRLPKARPGALGAIGFSNGGFFSVLLAAQRKIKAGVSYYGAMMGVGQPWAANPFLQSFTRESSPVLIMIGENDTGIGLPPVRMMEKIMKDAGARYELVIYPDAEHGFDRNSLRPGNGPAGIDAWARTLAFLRAHVR